MEGKKRTRRGGGGGRARETTPKMRKSVRITCHSNDRESRIVQWRIHTPHLASVQIFFCMALGDQCGFCCSLVFGSSRWRRPWHISHELTWPSFRPSSHLLSSHSATHAPRRRESVTGKSAVRCVGSVGAVAPTARCVQALRTCKQTFWFA